MEDFITILADEPDFMAGTTMRGTASEGIYGGMTVCGYTGDDTLHVAGNLTALTSALGVVPEKMIMPRQTHTATVKIIDDVSAIPPLYAVDGLITTVPGLVIGVNAADCVPVLLADAEAGIVAAVHAGWKGAVAGIAANAVELMCRRGADALRMRAYIAPCIHVECFEVGEEVAGRFPDEYVNRTFGSKPHVDLPGYVAGQLLAAGLKLENIYISQECTRCRPDRYFSARALGIDSGRNFSFIFFK